MNKKQEQRFRVSDNKPLNNWAQSIIFLVHLYGLIIILGTWYEVLYTSTTLQWFNLKSLQSLTVT